MTRGGRCRGGSLDINRPYIVAIGHEQGSLKRHFDRAFLDFECALAIDCTLFWEPAWVFRSSTFAEQPAHEHKGGFCPSRSVFPAHSALSRIPYTVGVRSRVESTCCFVSRRFQPLQGAHLEVQTRSAVTLSTGWTWARAIVDVFMFATALLHGVGVSRRRHICVWR